MKILHIIPSFNTGGGEAFTVDLCNELSRQGEEVVLCSLFDRTSEQFLADRVVKGVKVVTLAKKKGFDLFMLWKILLLVWREKPNVINTHLGALTYAMLIPFLYFKRVKRFHTIHSIASKETGTWRIIRLFQLIFFVPISISKQVNQSIVEMYGEINSPIIPNGASLSDKSLLYDDASKLVNSIKPTKNTKVFINVGTIYPVKNQKMLCEAFSRTENDAILIIIGDIPYNHFETLKDDLKLISPEKIFLLGKKNNVQDYMKLADYFCLSSLWEGLPLSLIEAMGNGCVPICTPVGGILDVVNENNGFLSSSVKLDDMVKTLNMALNLNENEYTRLSKNSVADYTDNFSMYTCANRYLSVYAKV